MRRVAAAAGLVAVVVALAGCGSSDSKDLTTVLHGTHQMTYSVTGQADGPVTLTYGDPATGDAHTEQPDTLPWSKRYVEQDQDLTNSSIEVDNSKNDAAVHCSVLSDGKSLVEKNIAAGQDDRCSALF